MGYVRAYIPLLAAFVVIFAAVWAYNSFGPHTPSAAESFQTIENKWKSDRDAARLRVMESAAKGDFAAEIAAYKDLSKYTSGWTNELQNSTTHWTASTDTTTDNQAAASTMLAFIQDGKNLVQVIDEVTAANTPDALAQHADDLQATDSQWNDDFTTLEHYILGAITQVTPPPTLQLPTQAPSATPAPSGSAEPSGPASASASAPASAAPSASASAVPSPTAAPSGSVAPSPSAS